LLLYSTNEKNQGNYDLWSMQQFQQRIEHARGCAPDAIWHLIWRNWALQRMPLTHESYIRTRINLVELAPITPVMYTEYRALASPDPATNNGVGSKGSAGTSVNPSSTSDITGDQAGAALPPYRSRETRAQFCHPDAQLR